MNYLEHEVTIQPSGYATVRIANSSDGVKCDRPVIVHQLHFAPGGELLTLRCDGHGCRMEDIKEMGMAALGFLSVKRSLNGGTP